MQTIKSQAQLLKTQQQADDSIRAEKLATTAKLLAADRARATSTLLSLHYNLSRTTARIVVK